MRSTRRRRAASVALAVALLLGGAATDAAPAAAAPAPTARGVSMSELQRTVFDQVNQQRGMSGRSRLAARDRMMTTAQRWAEELARCRCLKHRAPPFQVGKGWYAAAENVGYGPSLSSIHSAFMNSPGHRRNILTRRFTHLGVGVARDGNTYYVVHAFADFTP